MSEVKSVLFFRLNGLLIILLISLANLIALLIILTDSLIAGIVYLGICCTAPLLILRFFCTKCPCKKKCMHIIPGMITALLFKTRDGKYTTTDILMTVVGFGLLILFPQYWLIQELPIFSLYWIITIMSAIAIPFTLCPRCGNQECPFHR